jgi:hypothetical protein
MRDPERLAGRSGLLLRFEFGRKEPVWNGSFFQTSSMTQSALTRPRPDQSGSLLRRVVDPWGLRFAQTRKEPQREDTSAALRLVMRKRGPPLQGLRIYYYTVYPGFARKLAAPRAISCRPVEGLKRDTFIVLTSN